MKTQIQLKEKINTFKVINKTSLVSQRVSSSFLSTINLKFYQKVFLLLMTMSTFLIFPELPKENENICESHYSKQICNVW